jgi:AcrR family transcriptional regulator
MDDDGSPADVRERVFAAAYDELARWGIDRFSIPALAHRHGLDPADIQQHWPDEEKLILDVLLWWPRQEMTLPDSGSLRTDMFFLALGMASYLASGEGHQLQGTHLIGDRQLRSVEIRRKLWQARAGRLSVVFDRGRERGEMRTDIETGTALELLFAPLNMRALFTGEPVDEHYCRTVADLVWRAISADA